MIARLLIPNARGSKARGALGKDWVRWAGGGKIQEQKQKMIARVVSEWVAVDELAWGTNHKLLVKIYDPWFLGLKEISETAQLFSEGKPLRHPRAAWAGLAHRRPFSGVTVREVRIGRRGGTCHAPRATAQGDFEKTQSIH